MQVGETQTRAYTLGATRAVAPTRVRYKVLALLVGLAALTYLDRLCISVAGPAIMQEFNFSPIQMGYIYSAFTFAYALFEVPSGWFGDRFGTRRALTRIVLWWSAFTMLTGAAPGDSARYLWLKLPYCENYKLVANATTLPILLLGGEPVGRNILYPGGDNPLAVIEVVGGTSTAAGRSDRHSTARPHTAAAIWTGSPASSERD